MSAGAGIRSYGVDALLVELDSPEEAVLLARMLDHSPPAGVIETIPGLRTLMVRFDPEPGAAERLARTLADLVQGLGAGGTPDGYDDEPLTVRVEYGGPDLDVVAELTGLTAAEVIAVHQLPSYRVALIGMAPGFYYLAGGDPRLQVPRRSTPRERVPRGAVGLAGAHSGIYPKVGPGGWQLIGQVVDELWHPTRIPAALLRPGAGVRLVAA